MEANSGMLNITSENNITTAGGIGRFELVVDDAVVPPASLKVVPAGVAGASATFDVVPGQQVQIGIHLHLLPVGQQEIRFELDSAGANIGSVNRAIMVAPRSGQANQISDMLRKNETPLIFEGPCDSRYYPYHDPGAAVWFDRPNPQEHIKKNLESGVLSTGEAANLRQFVEQGYMIVEDLVAEGLIDTVNSELDQAIANGYGGYEYGSSDRIEHLHFDCPGVRELWLHPALQRYASLIFDDRALPCQTLAFVFGSQQDPHQDTIHLTPFPAGYMCGIWIALQDINPDSGELVVYPGSHREPRIYAETAGCPKVQNGDWSEFGQTVVPVWREMTTRYDEVVYRPKKGSVLFWHENLLHGGSPRLDKTLERRSLVIHAFSDSAIVYYDSTGSAGIVAR